MSDSVQAEIASPTLDEVRACKVRLRAHIVETPTVAVTSTLARELLGADSSLAFKLECFQATGTFKVRGALNLALRLDPAVRKHGLTAFSAGNHAIAVAYAARQVGTSAKVVMVRGADPGRVERARAYGAEVVFAEPAQAPELSEAIARDEGRTFIHPFEGRHVAEATGGLAIEIEQQYGRPDLIVVAVGGGGLAGGIACAAKALWPDCTIVGVEPEAADNLTQSLAAGRAIWSPARPTIADSLTPPLCLPYSFELCRRNLDKVIRITDAEMVAAMRLAYREWRLALEPAGAASLAALIGELRPMAAGRRVVAIVCGSTISLRRFTDLIGLA
jgi:threonine dehydratase